MSIKLSEIVPLGRSLQEYELMFNFGESDYSKKILGCGDGPASFNAEMTKKGYQVVSIDPIYQFSRKEIKQRFDDSIDLVIEQVNNTPNNWVWTYHKNSEDLRQNRIKAMKFFLEDYPQGLRERRYLVASLPKLPFADGEFDLALCSHLLFLYSDLLSLEFHLESIKKLCRVAKEVRIFPLLTLASKPSPYVEIIQAK